MAETLESGQIQPPERALAYHILRYVPDLIRDEWVNIGVLVFNPETGERRLRLIEDQDEYNAYAGCTRGPMKRCCAHCAMIWRIASNPASTADPKSRGKACWASGRKHFLMHCNRATKGRLGGRSGCRTG